MSKRTFTGRQRLILDDLANAAGSSTRAIATRVGITQRMAYDSLCRLERRGEVSSRRIGESVVWRVAVVA